MSTAFQSKKIHTQLDKCLNLLQGVLKKDLLGVYLYGSVILGGLQRYSDIDLFVVTNTTLTQTDKTKIVDALLKISGLYMADEDHPVEMTVVLKSEISPWHYPPRFEFLYGEWLRMDFESGNLAPWNNTVNPDLTLIVTQILLASSTLFGPDPRQLLPIIPYHDFLKALIESKQTLVHDLASDTRNVLLTSARIWATVRTDMIHSKPSAARWAINRLPKEISLPLKRAIAINKGLEEERWCDIRVEVQECFNVILQHIDTTISSLSLDDIAKKTVTLSKF